MTLLYFFASEASEASQVCWILKFKKSASEAKSKTQRVSQFLGIRWESNDNHTLVRYLLLWRTKFLEFVSHCFWMMIALLQFQFFNDICEGSSFLPDHKCKKLPKSENSTPIPQNIMLPTLLFSWVHFLNEANPKLQRFFCFVYLIRHDASLSNSQFFF